MEYLTSPGVERALTAARHWAKQLGSEIVQLTHFILALLDEEEGRAARLLQRLGLQLDQLRQQLLQLPSAPPAPAIDTLLALARDWSLSQRQDPQLLTDDLLLAVLQADPHFAAAVARFGLDLDRLRTASATATSLPPAKPITDMGNGDTSTDDTARSEAMGNERTAVSGGGAGGLGDTPLTFLSTPPSLAVGVAQPDHPSLPAAEPPEGFNPQVLRLLDANCNRCREALRVLDDYCRFVLDDAVLTGQIKQLRHAFARWEQRLPLADRLAARNTPGDVGTTLTGEGEYVRQSLQHVAAINLKRLQESLRSLEEYGKLLDPEWAVQAEQFRYRVYTLEGRLLRRLKRFFQLAQARLYWLFSVSTIGSRWEWMLERAVAGGVQIVQLREKHLPDRLWLERARAVCRRCREWGALFIVNDRPDLARWADADGVHLGQDDAPLPLARQLLGPDAILGCSTHTPEQIRQAIADGADYLGVGPIFPSPTKHFDHFPGLEFARQATDSTRLPAFALGGITLDNLPQLLATGIRRVAVSSLLAQADDPFPIAQQLRAALDAFALPAIA